MNANENKKPIGFELELTDEQLKDAAGGAGSSVIVATYRCMSCGAKQVVKFTSPDNPSDRLYGMHMSPQGLPCDDPMQLVKTSYITR